MKYFGEVKRVCITNNNLKYAVVEIENEVDMNYRLFIPTDTYKIGDKIEVSVVNMSQQKTQPKKVVKPPSKEEIKQITEKIDINIEEARKNLVESFVVDVEPVKQGA